MKFRFKPNEPFDAGVRRIGAEQLELAERQLAHARDASERGAQIHEARKCLKRVRSLLRLVRPSLSHSTYSRENSSLRGIGNDLSGSRDIQVMQETLAKIKASLRDQDSLQARCLRSGAFLENLSAALGRRRAEIETTKAGTLASALARLKDARHRWQRLELDAHGFRVVGRGLESTYAQGRAALTGLTIDGSDESYHDLRKQVQLHWRQSVLLQRAWPEVLMARAGLAKDVSQMLGEDHDLAVLAQFVRQQGSRLGTEAELQAFLALSRDTQQALRIRLQPRAMRLFAEEPVSFRRRMRDYWDTSNRVVKHAALGKPGFTAAQRAG